MPPATERRRLRPLVEADLDAAARFEQQRAERPWSREQLRDELGRAAWALELDGVLAGHACLSLLPPEAELLTIVVDERRRGHGHGGWLLDRLIEQVVGAGCTELRLEVRPSNDAALALYRGRGFEAVGRRVGYYSATGEDALVLRYSTNATGRRR